MADRHAAVVSEVSPVSDLALQLIAENKRTRSTSLDLGNCRLSKIPPELGELVWLESLILAGNWWEWDGESWQGRTSQNSGARNAPVTNIESLARLHRLRFLVLQNIGDLGPLAGLSDVQTLYVSGTHVSDLTPLAGLSALLTLDVSGTHVSGLAPLAGLSALQTLNVSGTHVSDLAPLARLSALQTLYVSGTHVSDLAPLARLSALQTLSVLDTQISDLAPLAGLSALQTLDVEGTQVSDLAPLAGISALQALNVSATQVSDLAPLAGLSALQTLNVSRTQVSDLAPLAGLSALQDLNVSGTQISDLAPLAGLSLRTLYVSRTQVSDLSPLAALIARGCPVQWSSESWIGHGIYIEDCPLQSPPPEIARQGNEAILNYFRERALGKVDHLYEAKMLILGEGGSGKTTLLRRLYQPGLPLPTEKETTKGVAIYRHEFEMKNGRRFRLNVWDFGGQEIYHATHQFFLTHRSLYLLVDDTRKDYKSVSDEGFKYWLELIDVFGGHSPVLIFQNEKGGRTKQIDIAGIKGRYDNVKELYGGNLEHSGAAGQVRQGIEFFAANLSHIGEELPSRWIDVRAEIEKRAGEVPYIPQEEYFQIYGRHLEFDRSRALHLSRYLHDLGVFLHFQDDPLLARTVILQNQWATEAVFRILDDETAKAKRGRFDGLDCERLWKDSVYADMHPELLALMQRFELCYELRDSNPPTWLAPQLLPPAKPGGLHGWGGPGDLVLRYSYAFLPKGTISRLTVRLQRFVSDPEMAWITGVLCERDSSAVLVEVLPNGSEIELRARGPERKALLSVVAADLDTLNDGFQGLRDRVEKRIPCNCTRCRTAGVPEFFGERNLLRRKQDNRLRVECPASYEDVDVLELLDGVRMDQLPGWAKAEPAGSALRTIRIFLASSSELREDRDAFDLYFRQQNDQLRKRGVYLEIVRWENFLDAMSETRLQDEYNKEIRTCDIFVCLFFTKTGKFTEEEFDVAHRQFLDRGRPRIFTFFKNADFKTGDARPEDFNSLWVFQNKLKKLGHFHTQYEHIEHLKRQFGDQIDRLVEQRGVASNLLN
jgi:Leucine-rich repeat (LRR) protein